MIKVYILPSSIENNTEVIAAEESIRNALLIPMPEPLVWKLIQDTTPEEHTALDTVAIDVLDPTQLELDNYSSTVIIPEPDPDYERACELLATSAPAITQPEMWELARIFGKILGYRFD